MADSVLGCTSYYSKSGEWQVTKCSNADGTSSVFTPAGAGNCSRTYSSDNIFLNSTCRNENGNKLSLDKDGVYSFTDKNGKQIAPTNCASLAEQAKLYNELIQFEQH
jgi:hypothetical protein